MTVLWLCSEQAVVSCPHERVQYSLRFVIYFYMYSVFFLVVFLTMNLWAPPNKQSTSFPRKKSHASDTKSLANGSSVRGSSGEPPQWVRAELKLRTLATAGMAARGADDSGQQ